METEAVAILRWTRQNGHLIDPQSIAAFFDEARNGGHLVGGGIEHTVVVDPASHRVIKVTQSCQFGTKGLAAWIHNAQRANKLFADGQHLLGAVEYRPGDVRLALSQPFVAGRDATRPEIDWFLFNLGYYRVSEVTYFNPDCCEAISDAKVDNFVLSEADGQVHPIDVHFLEPSSSTASVWEDIINSGSYPTPVNPQK